MRSIVSKIADIIFIKMMNVLILIIKFKILKFKLLHINKCIISIYIHLYTYTQEEKSYICTKNFRDNIEKNKMNNFSKYEKNYIYNFLKTNDLQLYIHIISNSIEDILLSCTIFSKKE